SRRLEIGPLAVGHPDLRLDSPAHGEIAHHLQPSRAGGGHEIVHDPVRHVPVEGALVAIRPEVELERLQLDEMGVGNEWWRSRTGRRATLARLWREGGRVQVADLRGGEGAAVHTRLVEDAGEAVDGNVVAEGEGSGGSGEGAAVGCRADELAVDVEAGGGA